MNFLNLPGRQKKLNSDVLDQKFKTKLHGKDMWTVLHVTAAFLPGRLNDEEKTDFENFVKGILYFGTKFNENWRKGTDQYLYRHPFKFSSRSDSILWLCHFHNDVNKKLGKDLFECKEENLGKRWGNLNKIKGEQPSL